MDFNIMKLAEEPFLTLEGEGPNIGIPTLFIRFFGCNMSCKYCDSKYSYNPYAETISYTPGELIQTVLEMLEPTSVRRISITGGEPTLQEKELVIFINEFNEVTDNRFMFNLETNGSILASELFHIVDEISCDIKGPSSGEKFNPIVISYLLSEFIHKTCFKFVVSTREDIDFIKQFRTLPNKYIMKDSYSKISTKLIVNFILKMPECAYSTRLQELLKIK